MSRAFALRTSVTTSHVTWLIICTWNCSHQKPFCKPKNAASIVQQPRLRPHPMWELQRSVNPIAGLRGPYFWGEVRDGRRRDGRRGKRGKICLVLIFLLATPLVTALCNQPEAFASELGDDQSRGVRVYPYPRVWVGYGSGRVRVRSPRVRVYPFLPVKNTVFHDVGAIPNVFISSLLGQS